MTALLAHFTARSSMKRLLCVVVALTAIACLGCCIYAGYWIWAVKKPAIDTATYGFDTAEHWLAVADKAGDDVAKNLEVSRNQMLVVQSTTSAADGNGPGPVETMLVRTIVRQMTANVSDVQQTVEKVTAASMVVNSVLDSMHDVPVNSLERLDTQQVQNLQTQLDGVTKAGLELSALLPNSDGANGAAAADKSARIAASLSQIIVMVQDFQQRVKALRERIGRIRNDTLYWLRVGPTWASIGLGWIALSQLIVMAVAARGLSRESSS
jgi:hypothetical protein